MAMCQKCHVPVSESDLFCGECGTRIKKDTATVVGGDASSKSLMNGSEPARAIWLVGGILFVLVLGQGVVIAYLLFGDGPPSIASQQKSRSTASPDAVVESSGYTTGPSVYQQTET